jgi:hypothetical protein
LAESLALCLFFLGAHTSRANPTRRDAELNGPRLNGIELVGRDEGSRLSLLFATLQPGVVRSGGGTVKGVTLEGTALRSTSVRDASAWEGALLEGEASGHTPVRLRIDHIAPAPRLAASSSDPSDVLTYAVSYQWGSWSGAGAARTWKPDSEWAPLCPSDELAIPIAGRWDYHQGQRGDGGRINADRTLVTFACRGAAIAKCAEKMGYKPWLPARQPQGAGTAISMDSLHQACVRAVRADYCGNGDSLTLEGKTVNFYDTVGILKDTENWPFEAAWTPTGASCINSTRLLNNPEDAKQTVTGYIAQRCLASFSETPCVGIRQARSALLFTKHSPLNLSNR